MTILDDGRVELVCMDGNRVALNPSKRLDVIEADPGFVRIERPRGWGVIVHGDYEAIRDALSPRTKELETIERLRAALKDVARMCDGTECAMTLMSALGAMEDAHQAALRALRPGLFPDASSLTRSKEAA